MKLKRLRDIFLMFMACAFLGWIYEVPVGLLETHVGYVNRGFFIQSIFADLWFWRNYINSTFEVDKK